MFCYPPSALSHGAYAECSRSIALDTGSPISLLNSLVALTYLTSTSPRIREILTQDGGLERLLDILRASALPQEVPDVPDLWGLNGPSTARVITQQRIIFLRQNLAFQSVVNIGVRGNEAIRTRVVQAGALDVVAQILESWLRLCGISILAGPMGSQAAVDAINAGRPVPGTTAEDRRRLIRQAAAVNGQSHHAPAPAAASTSRSSGSGILDFVSNVANLANIRRPSPATQAPDPIMAHLPHRGESDVEMADAEGEDGTDVASVGIGDDSMDVEEETDMRASRRSTTGHSVTPRPEAPLLPSTISPAPGSRDPSQGSSAGTSYSEEGMASSSRMPRASSSHGTGSAPHPSLRPPALNLSAARIPQLAQDPVSNQSSPMATPTRQDSDDPIRPLGRRGTIVARPVNVNLAPRNERQRNAEAGSGASDGGEDIDLPTATLAAGIAAAEAQAMESGGTVVPDDPGPPPNVEIVEGMAGDNIEEPSPEQMAAEQARLDMEAGAPPGQPGAAQTPRVTATTATPRQATNQATDQAAEPNDQIIIANSAPRGFQDLSSYVGVSCMINPDGDRYSDDSVLLALQLLAYLSKYPNVRSAFHHPRRPMHPTFDLKTSDPRFALPQRAALSHTANVFSLVERFTFRSSPSDPLLHRIPEEIQYWAGVIMRNACRKDEARGGIRQCAHMTCGKWEKYPREFAKCRRCRKAKYCSKECQSRAWSEGHRFWCSTGRDDPAPHNGRSEHGDVEETASQAGQVEEPEPMGPQEIAPGPPVEPETMVALPTEPAGPSRPRPRPSQRPSFNALPTPPAVSSAQGNNAFELRRRMLQDSILGPRRAYVPPPPVPASLSEPTQMMHTISAPPTTGQMDEPSVPQSIDLSTPNQTLLPASSRNREGRALGIMTGDTSSETSTTSSPSRSSSRAPSRP